MVKVCGLRKLPHMLAAAAAGADLVGVVFVPGVRRRVDPEVAHSMVEGLRASFPQGSPRVVGLFANQPVEEVDAIAELVGLDLVQLCGAEDAAYRARMRHPVLQVVHVPTLDEDVPEKRRDALARLDGRLTALAEAGGLALLDRESEKQPGGLGQSFDWSLARSLADAGHRFMLAGGLTLENVGEAVAVAQPHGVDVSSGVETDGAKDAGKIRAFVVEARRALDA